MGYKKASMTFNVPKSTIFDKVKGNTPMNCTSGTHPVLNVEEEGRLADWMIDMSKIGYGRTRQELLDTVQKIIQADGRPNPFKNGRPGKDWYYAFMKRHPHLSMRSPRQLGKERAVIKPENIEKWFTDFEQFIKDTVDDPNVLLDPSRIYNADESGFSMCAQTGRVIGLKGARSVYNISASDRSQITVLCGMSASGHFLRPLIVFPGQRFTRYMLEGFEEAVMGRSANGWMDSDLFATWLKTVFIPDIDQRQVKRPVILLVDGHSTHMTLEASDICKDNGIILYCLLEHASHLIQPCDLRLFGPLKEAWKVCLREWQIEHVGEYVTKFEFAAIFKHAWYRAAKVEHAVCGFRDAGIFPLNKQTVLATDKFQACKLFARPSKQSENQASTSNENPSTEHGQQAAPASNTPVHVPGEPSVPGKEQAATPSSPGERQALPSDLSSTVELQATLLAPDEQQATLPSVSSSLVEQQATLSSDPSAPGEQLAPLPAPDEQQATMPSTSSPPGEQQVPTRSGPSITAEQQAATPSTVQKLDEQHTTMHESPLSKILKIPSPAPKTSRTSVKRKIIPKAITGLGFREFLLERKTKAGRRRSSKEGEKAC